MAERKHGVIKQNIISGDWYIVSNDSYLWATGEWRGHCSEGVGGGYYRTEVEAKAVLEYYARQEAPQPITPAPGKWVLDNGEVVELKCSPWATACVAAVFPFRFGLPGSVNWHYVTSSGDCIRDYETTPFARLSHPYVEKTPVERLRDLKQRVGNPVHEEIDGIIAAMEKA